MAIEILMPALSPTMTEGKLAKWLVKEGDTIKSGDVIAEIETDKATMEVEAVDEGTLAKILVPEGTDNVAVNTVIALVAAEGEDVSAAPAPKAAPAAAPAPAAAAPAPTVTAPVAVPGPAAAGGARVFASPLARRIAKNSGVDLAAVTGSGPHGRIVKADVEAAAKAPKAAPAPVAAAPAPAPVAAPAPAPKPAVFPFPEGSFTSIPNDGMRKTVAKRLTEAKSTIPHFYLTIDCELDALLELRTQLNAKSPAKISVNDFIVRASALALKKVPAANATWTDEAILRHRHADVAVAVAIDGGLITPIVFNAEGKGLAAIAAETKDLAERARGRKLKPAEYQGGTFSISNLGMFGIKEFAAVINPPHGAILAIGAGEKRPVVKAGALAVATVMTVTLSCDHRVVDGAVGAEFLAAFKGLIEDPITMML
ncbi:pyruvate dehydrogenase complex dihydrolipoamide acetyltransferase [Zavarzinia compransoris]|uniref:Acetyltransferase component of pyruvate dehydrogenase complex n=1 Tax=Zavarzinia compransoris TaxID=1264899 RepID=A0A317EBV3_9PROT|nr:pyruvate dehydrogenase complex dihydrolipoamide acetyltransferase [Zavarzinia compransoris]PWR23774.1 pyruvate dehydrogenase complex dihydrolipoamide acetyltransferase [Zavarzinia compransoris]TDP48004.1 pyruvate dehydrogenase E2 component (dihydrolipoamide acetyltransferase) [Zavarzinia compransoris]